ncbi:MAG: hypothetical protein WAO02_07095 [Verrucomicrobiia bacterium]
MKTIKNVIPLAVAVVFFAALNVQAHFDPSVGRWASRDPVDEIGFKQLQLNEDVSDDAEGGPNPYAFVANAPTLSIDEYGLKATLTIHISSTDSLSCGGWNNVWSYYGNADDSYWMVQEIIVGINYMDCANKPQPPEKDDWLEAVLVGPGYYATTDHDYMPPIPNTIGTRDSTSARATLIRASSKRGKEISGWGHQVTQAPDDNATRNIPSWWPTVDFFAARNSWKNSWNCCCGKHDDGTLQHSP